MNCKSRNKIFFLYILFASQQKVRVYKINLIIKKYEKKHIILELVLSGC